MKNYHQFIDDLMITVNAAVTGAELHSLARNRQLNATLRCARCVSTIYLSVDQIYHAHLHRNAAPPKVTCPNCNCTSDSHEYIGISR